MTKKISDFCGGDGERLASAFEFLGENKGETLLLESKIYSVSKPLCLTAEEVTVDGCGATIRFEGDKGGLLFSGCRSVSFKNIYIEFAGVCDKYAVLASCALGFSIRNEGELNKNLDGFGKNGKIALVDGKEERFLKMLETDRIRSVEVSCDGAIWVAGDFTDVKLGDFIYVLNPERSEPAIRLENSSFVELENLVILSGFGEGIAAENCDGLHFTRTNIVSRPGGNLSVCKDGMKFTACGGVKLTDCAIEGILGTGVVIESPKPEGKAALSGVYVRNSLNYSVLAPTGNLLLEGCLFDACRDTAICLYGADSDCETVITHNRIHRRGEKYRFEVRQGAGAVAINPDSDTPCRNIKISLNSIVCGDTAGAIYANRVDGIEVYGNELLALSEHDGILFRNCTDIKEEANRI